MAPWPVSWSASFRVSRSWVRFATAAWSRQTSSGAGATPEAAWRRFRTATGVDPPSVPWAVDGAEEEEGILASN